MKIANQQTFRQFDKLKEEIFHKKIDETKAAKIAKNPIAAKVRLLYPMALIAGGLWLIYTNMPSINDILLQKQLLTYQELLALQTMKLSLKCRLKEIVENPRLKVGHNLYNDLYLTKLESDYLYLIEKRPQRNIEIETKTSFSWWMINLSNRQLIHLINPYGDLVTRKRSSKIMLGESFRIWTRTTDTVVKREKTFQNYLKQRGNIGNQCQRINWINKLQLKQNEYTELLVDCKGRSKRIAQKIQKHIERRLADQKKRNVINIQA